MMCIKDDNDNNDADDDSREFFFYYKIKNLKEFELLAKESMI